MRFIHIQGKVDVTTYNDLCEKNEFNPKDKKVIFIFPGNSSHHAVGTTLFSIKSGGGLATASAAIGVAGYPTLSLPTTTMEKWATDDEQQQIVHGAMADLYKALGAGFQFMLPVRVQKNTQYFDHPLDPPERGLEPSFWGGIQTAANKPLANYYIDKLNALTHFIALSAVEREAQIQADQDNPFYQSYVHGQTMPIDDPWLAPKDAVKKILAHNEAGMTGKSDTTANVQTDINPETRVSYEKLYGINQDALTNARNLLNDYTKNNSSMMRFFSGHWNRHHMVEINQLVERIDNKQITDAADLMNQLKDIVLVNPNGSLARRIRFIEETNPSDPNLDTSPASFLVI